MSPAAVNNSARQNMADIRAQWNDASWFAYGTGSKNTVIPVYVSGTSFKVVGVDVTAYWHIGRRVKAVGSGTGTIYGTITNSAFSSDTTLTVSWDSGSLSNEALAIYASTIQATGGPIPPTAIGGNSIAWTPTDASGAGLSLTVSTAKYVRFGNLICAWAQIQFPATADATQIQIGGLPVTSLSGVTTMGSFPVHGLSTDFGLVVANSTSFKVWTSAGGARANANYSGATFYFMVWYPVA